MRTMSAGEARRALAAMERESRTPIGVGTWIKRAFVGAVVIGILTLIWGWAMGWFSTPAQVLEVRAAINQQIAELDRAGKGQAPYAGPDMGRVFGAMRDLPEDMRNQVRRDFGRLMEANETAQVNSFFNLPPGQRQAELDRRLKADEDRRKKFMADRGDRGSNRGGGQRPGGQPGAGGGPPGGGPGGGRGPGGGGGPRGGGSEEDRNNRRKSALDSSAPEQRARRTEYRRLLDERKQQMSGSR